MNFNGIIFFPPSLYFVSTTYAYILFRIRNQWHVTSVQSSLFICSYKCYPSINSLAPSDAKSKIFNNRSSRNRCKYYGEVEIPTKMYSFKL